jgi:hypothetical protein
MLYIDKKYFYQILKLLILLILILCQSFAAYAQTLEKLEKPSVAIKSPVAGEGVSKGSLRSLNLSQLLAEMEASIQATRKFEVVTRQKDKLGAIREEQEFAQSDFAKGNAAQEGQLKNANYLIIPVVQHFEFGRSTRPVPNISNKYFRRDSGLLEINAQVLDTTSGAIKTTFYLKSSFGTSDEVVNSSGGGPGSGYFVTMAKKVAAQMADQLVDTVFPMRILNVQDNQVWINRGADGGLKVNETLNVYKPGAELVDPDTNEKLGSAEKLIGKIKVVRVNPKFTIAEVQTKDMKDPIDKGYVIRKP